MAWCSPPGCNEVSRLCKLLLLPQSCHCQHHAVEGHALRHVTDLLCAKPAVDSPKPAQSAVPIIVLQQNPRVSGLCPHQSASTKCNPHMNQRKDHLKIPCGCHNHSFRATANHRPPTTLTTSSGITSTPSCNMECHAQPSRVCSSCPHTGVWGTTLWNVLLTHR